VKMLYAVINDRGLTKFILQRCVEYMSPLVTYILINGRNWSRAVIKQVGFASLGKYSVQTLCAIINDRGLSKFILQ
jgi:hypothetical protein